jgi:Protein of unknown function (DUF2946)
VNWFRKHVKTGSRLALFALAIQFALSFGHFHGQVARAAPAAQAGLADADHTIAASPQAGSEAAQQQPSGHDTDQHTTGCAICAVLSLANNFLFATPPLLAPPQAVALLHRVNGAEFAHLGSLHPAFQSRAPPVS